MNWNLAHRIAGIAAAQAHRDLKIDRTGYVPVHSALGRAGITGIARPLPRLFGVYFAPAQQGPAVLLNARLDVITQRHTAAHELGHHILRHGTAADQELDRSAQWGDGTWPDEEKTAEAFAAWFLMPRPAVLATLRALDAERPETPEHAYLLARALGTSYAGTVRQLVRLRLLSRDAAHRWLRIQPAAVKASLLGGIPAPAGVHVHVITARTRSKIVYADAGDLVVLRLPQALSELPEYLAPWSPPGQIVTLGGDIPAGATLQVTDAFTGFARCRIAETDTRGDALDLCIERQSARQGIDETWPP